MIVEDIVKTLHRQRWIREALEQANPHIPGRIRSIGANEDWLAAGWDDGLQGTFEMFRLEDVSELLFQKAQEEVARAERYETYLRLKEEFGE